MMRVSKLVMMSILGLAVVSCKKEAKQTLLADTNTPLKLTTKLDSVSYAIGVSASGQAKVMKEGLNKEFKLTLNTVAFTEGFKNKADSTNIKISLEKSKTLLESYFAKQRQLAAARAKDSLLNNFSDATISNNASLVSKMDSVSYALGVNYSGQLKRIEQDLKTSLDIDLNKRAFFDAYISSVKGSDLKISVDDSKTLLNSYLQEKQKIAGEKNKKAGEDFLVANKSKSGVKTTASGLQYIVLKEGTGEVPTVDSKVKVHYHGTLVDGKVFDSSIDRGQPAEFGVSQVIKGWTEGLQLMKKGAKYKFFIPQELAYGPKPAGQLIKPFSTLIFEVELLDVK